jgi:hypothetical protein
MFATAKIASRIATLPAIRTTRGARANCRRVRHACRRQRRRQGRRLLLFPDMRLVGAGGAPTILCGAKWPHTLCYSSGPNALVNLWPIRVMVIDEVEGQSNLNHHKSDEDHVAVPNRLARSGDSAGRVLAEKMRVLRPGLAYEFPNG